MCDDQRGVPQAVGFQLRCYISDCFIDVVHHGVIDLARLIVDEVEVLLLLRRHLQGRVYDSRCPASTYVSNHAQPTCVTDGCWPKLETYQKTKNGLEGAVEDELGCRRTAFMTRSVKSWSSYTHPDAWFVCEQFRLLFMPWAGPSSIHRSVTSTPLHCFSLHATIVHASLVWW